VGGLSFSTIPAQLVSRLFQGKQSEEHLAALALAAIVCFLAFFKLTRLFRSFLKGPFCHIQTAGSGDPVTW